MKRLYRVEIGSYSSYLLMRPRTARIAQALFRRIREGVVPGQGELVIAVEPVESFL